MKKTYLVPVCNMVRMEEEEMVATSGMTSDNGIGYGGVDVDGNWDPEVKGIFN